MNTRFPSSPLAYAMASTAGTVSYVIIDGLGMVEFSGSYWLAIAASSFSALAGWRRLDTAVQLRIRKLLPIPHRTEIS